MIRRALNFTASSLLMPALCLAVSVLLPLQAAGKPLYKVSPKLGPHPAEVQSAKPTSIEASAEAPASAPEKPRTTVTVQSPVETIRQASYVPVQPPAEAKADAKPTLQPVMTKTPEAEQKPQKSATVNKPSSPDTKKAGKKAEATAQTKPAKHDRHPVVLAPIPLIPETPLPPEWVEAARKEKAAKVEASSKSPEVPVSLQTDLNPQPAAATLSNGQPPEEPSPSPMNGRVQFTAPPEITPEPELDTTPAPALRPATPIVSPAPEAAVQPETAKTPEKPSKASKKSKSQKAVNSSTSSQKASKSNPKTAHAVKTRKEKKQVVHFPAAMPDGPSSVPIARHKPAPSFSYPFPRGYKAYIPPAVGQKYEADQAAINHFNRANLLARRDRMADADAEYRRALTLNPDFADAYVGLSSVHLRKNDWENVFDETDRALSLKTGFRDPANIVQAEFNRSVAFCAANDRRNANRYFQRVKKAGHPLTDPLHAFLMHNCKP